MVNPTEGGERAQRRRLPPAERRGQLIDIGLQQLILRPGEPLSVDQVALEAQISRGLLFRYFATKQEFFAAVAQAMTDRIDAALDRDDHGSVDERQRRLVASYLRALAARPFWAASVSGGDFGVGGEVADVIMELRERLVSRSADLLGLPDDAVGRARLSAWWALVHDVGRRALGRAGESTDAGADEPVEELVSYCLAVQPAVLRPE